MNIMQIITSARQDGDEMEDGGCVKTQACVEHVSKRTRDS